MGDIYQTALPSPSWPWVVPGGDTSFSAGAVPRGGARGCGGGAALQRLPREAGDGLVPENEGGGGGLGGAGGGFCSWVKGSSPFHLDTQLPNEMGHPPPSQSTRGLVLLVVTITILPGLPRSLQIKMEPEKMESGFLVIQAVFAGFPKWAQKGTCLPHPLVLAQTEPSPA